MSNKPTMITNVSIDISTEGVKFTFTGMETDIASLIAEAGDYEALPITVHSAGTSGLVIQSKRKLQFVDRPTDTEETTSED